MKEIIIIALSALMLSGCFQETPSETSLSPTLQEARNRAMVLCSGCHGPEGTGTTDFNPNLACQKKTYMVNQLNFYRDGTRKTHPPMTHIARMLTDDEVNAISEWYSITGCNTPRK